jgi:CrcB protein
MTTLLTYAYIGIGGALGAMSRYAMFHALSGFEHKHIRLGVFAVNVLGSFLIGIALGLAVKELFFQRGTIAHVLFVTGFLGGFTTFSTFSQDNVEFFFLEHNITGFLVNSGANLLLGFLACALGYFLVTKGV